MIAEIKEASMAIMIKEDKMSTMIVTKETILPTKIIETTMPTIVKIKICLLAAKLAFLEREATK